MSPDRKLKSKYKRLIRIMAWTLFMIYMVIMIYFLFGSDALNRNVSSGYRYNLRPFKEIRRCFYCLSHNNRSYFMLNFCMNIAAFVPFGIVLPIIQEKSRKWYVLFLQSAAIIFLIEFLQLISKVGIFDVDDMILNITGSMAGYIIFLILWGIWKLYWYYKHKDCVKFSKKT